MSDKFKFSEEEKESIDRATMSGCVPNTSFDEPPVSQWRSLETEPPAFDVPVLVYQPKLIGQQVTLAEYVCRDSSGHKFCFDIQHAKFYRSDYRYSVTHWMPLPFPPDRIVID